MSEKKYKRRLGDRGDGRLVRNLTPMHKITPFIMWSETTPVILSETVLRFQR